MMNANKGYSGWSMSVRAVEAYEAGEMPKSKWTKSRMLDEIAAYYADNFADVSDDAAAYLQGLTKDELFARFFIATSWHHTSKLFNATDFYALDECAADEYAEQPTRRTYHVTYSLGRHGATVGKTFATRARAERHIARQGFERLNYSWWRGGFTARVWFDEDEI